MCVFECFRCDKRHLCACSSPPAANLTVGSHPPPHTALFILTWVEIITSKLLSLLKVFRFSLLLGKTPILCCFILDHLNVVQSAVKGLKIQSSTRRDLEMHNLS